MTNEREYFSAFSRDNGVFQSPKASNICFGRQAPLTSHSASPSLPVQGKGHLSVHGRTFWYLPLSFPQPLLSFLGPQCPCAIPGWPPPGAQWFPSAGLTHTLPQHYGILPAEEQEAGTGNPHWAPHPAQSPDMFW